MGEYTDDGAFGGVTYGPRQGDRRALPREGEHTGRGPRGYRRDDRIRAAVCEALTANGEVDASEVEVECEDGVVMLTGTVPDRRQKRLAEAIAEDQVGVHDVSNQLRIARPGSDTGPAGH